MVQLLGLGDLNSNDIHGLVVFCATMCVDTVPNHCCENDNFVIHKQLHLHVLGRSLSIGYHLLHFKGI